MPTPENSHSASTLQRTSLVDGVSFDVDADGLFDATFEGGAGTDTLNLVGGGSFDLTAAILSSIEVVRATDQDDTVLLDAVTLTDIETLDGGTGSNILRLNGSQLLDFTGRTVAGFSRLEATSKKFDVIFDDKATALKVWAQKAIDDTLTLVGGTFTEDERAQLHRQGVDTIIDDSGSYTNDKPRLGNFAYDTIYTSSAGQVFLDRGQDAAIGAMDDHFGSLRVTFEDIQLLAGQIAIVEGEGITLSDGMNDGSQVLFNGSIVGELALLDDGIVVSFDEAAVTEAVEALLHRLVYRNLDDSSSIREVYATVSLTDEGGRAANTNVAIMTGDPGTRFFDHGTDALQGTAGDDAFATDTLSLGAGDALDGGDGIDTLFLMQGGSFDLTQISLSGIERIEGSLEKDFITISGSQLASVTIIDGLDEFDAGTVADTSNTLNITGTGIDLRDKTIANFSSISLRTDGAVVTLNDKGLAGLISGSLTTGDRIDLVGGQVFTADERGALFRHGIETVSDASGTYTNKAPELQGFGGDRSVGWAGQSIFLDAGQNATLAEDDRLLSGLDVSVTGGSASDQLEIATTGRVRLQSSDTSLRVLVDDVDIGFVADPSVGPSLAAVFNQQATPERVQELVRALTYRDATGQVTGAREIKLTLTDYTFHSSTASVTIEQQRNEGPSAPTLSQAVVKELASTNTVVGSLSATDPNPGDAVSLTLVNDAGGRFALEGNRLLVKEGTKLDHEQAKSHQVTVRATDKLGSFKDSTFTIMVQDVAREVAIGTSGNDTFVGGRGRDKFYGKLGNDVLKGGGGKDTFVFDTKLGPANTDTIRDFSVKDDKLWLAKSVFRKAGAKGGLSSDAFWKGSKAHDLDDRIIYNQKTGILSYDADGSGSGKAVEIAALTKQLKLTHASFFIV